MEPVQIVTTVVLVVGNVLAWLKIARDNKERTRAEILADADPNPLVKAAETIVKMTVDELTRANKRIEMLTGELWDVKSALAKAQIQITELQAR